jgi:hypothetical protein
MAAIISNFFEIFHASGITTSSVKITQFMLRHPKFTFIFHFKVIPAVLEKVSDPLTYAEIISRLSVGRTYKTTYFQRHNTSDDIILDTIKKSKKCNQAIFADIGASDGSGSIYLIDKLKTIGINLLLLDKYRHIRVVKKWCCHQYVNEDNFIIGVKIFCFFIYTFTFRFKTECIHHSSITLLNPLLVKRNIGIDYFDVFTSQSSVPFSFAKIANVFNYSYFSREQILDGLKNLHRSIENEGILFIVHNYCNHESLLVLRKSVCGYSVEYTYGDPELLDLVVDETIRWDR